MVVMVLFIGCDLPPVLCLLLEKTQPAEEIVDGVYDLSKVDPSSDIHFKFSQSPSLIHHFGNCLQVGMEFIVWEGDCRQRKIQ